MKNEELIEKTLNEISKDSSWEERYEEYADAILKHEKIHSILNKRVSVKFPLSKYTSISKLKQGKVEMDIRFLGQSIGTLFLDKSENIPKFKKNKNLANIDTGIPKLESEENWSGKNMKKLRSFLHIIEVKDANTHSSEHKCENLLLREFSKRESKGKSLVNIQPITFDREFFQLTTNLKASRKGEVSYSKNGGGIDIMARVRHKDNKVYIAVFELKDQNNTQEPMSDVIQQALSYAVFIAKLLDSKAGAKWMRIFGYKGQCPKVIDVVGIIPKGKETFVEGEYKVGNYTLQTHTLYFDKEKLFSNEKSDFSGTFTDLLLNPNSNKSTNTNQ